jgi:hypothetical protein
LTVSFAILDVIAADILQEHCDLAPIRYIADETPLFPLSIESSTIVMATTTKRPLRSVILAVVMLLALIAFWVDRSYTTTRVDGSLLELYKSIDPYKKLRSTSISARHEAARRDESEANDDTLTAPQVNGSSDPELIFQDVSVQDEDAFVSRDKVTDDGFVDPKPPRFITDELQLVDDDLRMASAANNKQGQEENTTDPYMGPSEPDDRPPLDKLVNMEDWTILPTQQKDDAPHNHSTSYGVQSLLDFAVIGAPHCGNSFLVQWLRRHQQVQMHSQPVRFLQLKKPGKLVQTLYSLPTGRRYKRGYLNSQEMEYAGSLKILGSQWFNKTKLIVGIQHPVLWFERYYNTLQAKYNTTTGNNNESLFPLAESMVGRHFPNQVRFHVQLSLLQKTRKDGRAGQLLDLPFALWEHKLAIVGEPLTNPLFLYETRQLYDSDQGRLEEFRRDLQSFLQLEEELPKILPIQPPPRRPGAIHICDEKYRTLRHELMEVSMRASVWLRYYLLQSSDVKVSSPQNMEQLLWDWTIDPCQPDGRR